MKEEISNKKDELIRNTLVLTIQGINGAIPLVGELSDEFYRGPEQGTWIKLQQLIAAFEVINKSAGVIEGNQECLKGLETYLDITAGMRDKLDELLKALEKSDMVLSGDFLSYEILPLLEEIRDAAKDIVNNGDGEDASI